MRLLLAIILANILSNSWASSDSMLRRTKRYVVYPRGGLFKIVIGVAIPVKLGLKQMLSSALNIQFQYAAPQNITQLQQYPPIVSRTRERRDEHTFSDRNLAYRAVEGMLDRYGVNGRECLLRAICENSAHSLHHQANGLFGHLLHIFLTPNYGDGECDQDLDRNYIDAQRAGKFGVDCLSSYENCPYGHGVLDMISIYD